MHLITFFQLLEINKSLSKIEVPGVKTIFLKRKRLLILEQLFLCAVFNEIVYTCNLFSSIERVRMSNIHVQCQYNFIEVYV